MSPQTVLFVINPERAEAVRAGGELVNLLIARGFACATSSDVHIPGLSRTPIAELPDAQIAVVLGGDGTILRGAEVVRKRGIPILGINLGHVGFLAEVDKPSLDVIADSIAAKSYVTEKRMLLSYSVIRNDREVASGWALNEVTVERDTTSMVELFLQIDNRPLSRWGCDGLICATPTGSTAYAFSAGGPVLWPEINALVLLPISAHALFARPMVVSPTSKIVVELESSNATLSADALRDFPLLQGDRVLITQDSEVISLAHVNPTLFTDRLVAKFKLPVEGWRGE